ncbi:MAG: hypothetical protein CR984_02050 [Proteobacteria bacterium]|nr:MAG: hypothetical protein CR984_02050 [Pseudomonadota bacterium]
MIQETIDDIITALTGTPGIQGAPEQFAGNINDLAKKPQRLPALWVVYNGASFESRRTEAILARHTMQFSVILIAKNHRSRADGAEACHPIIEAIRPRLFGRLVTDVGELWPEREQLISAVGPLFVYGLNYKIETKFIN